MAVTLTNIETIVRNLIADTERTMQPGDLFTYESSSVFTLTESNVNSVSSVLHNDSALTVTTEYTYDEDTNRVTVSATLTSGDTIEVQYTYYPNYSSTEIQNYIKAAITHLSVKNYYTFVVEDSTVYPEPEEKEKNLKHSNSIYLIQIL